MDRRSFLRASTQGGLAFLAAPTAVSCATSPEIAYEPWNGPSPQLAGEDLRLSIVAYGLLAPSFKNAQPWWVDLKGDGIVVRSEPQRSPVKLDPAHRQLTVSLGAFVETMAIAATHAGRRMSISAFPERNDNDLMTENTIAASCSLSERTSQEDPLFGAIMHRRTNRLTYDGRSLTDDHASTLRSTDVPATVQVAITQQPDATASLREIARNAALDELTHKALRQEVLQHVRMSDQQVRRTHDGITLVNAGVSYPERLWYRLRSALGGGDNTSYLDLLPDLLEEQIRSAAAFGVLVTEKDTPKDRLEAGRALMRLHLQATKLGVSFQPLSSAVGSPKDRTSIAASVGLPDLHAQCLFRLGYADPVPPSPRRSLFEIVRI